MSLLDEIETIVEAHSGGVKFPELIGELVERHYGEYSEEERRTLPYTVERVIRESKSLKILDYTWKTLDRAKMFIYTP